MRYEIVPESAPFSAEQRAWLNGFFAGILGALDTQNTRSGSAVSLDAAVSMLSPLAGLTSPTDEQAEDAPWHDSTLSIDDRMKLADGKPLAKRMMAAMAQLDCGTCGYLCKTYAEALANGSEKSVSLCTPGGKETSKMLRVLVKEISIHQDSSQTIELNQKGQEVGSRQNPAELNFIASDRLNGEGSAKDTRHVRIDLGASGMTYNVGDALGIWPTNCPDLVLRICQLNHLDPMEMVEEVPEPRYLSDVLRGRCLRKITDDLCERVRSHLLAKSSRGLASQDAVPDLKRLEQFIESDDYDEWDVHEFLESFDVKLSSRELIDCLPVLQPRLYSIASCQNIHHDEVHLTVGRVVSDVRNRMRKGVASTMFADRLVPGAKVRAFVHRNHGFTTPKNIDAPVIMVGPGTGIAPFIAFLQQREFERKNLGAKGENWLFFGDQKRSVDFLYEEQLTEWKVTGVLSRLDVAFSRDHQEKVYVQHRMKEQGAEVYRWLENGSYFYVCGDARRMAKDVDQALLEIVAKYRSDSVEEAKEYLKELRAVGRYSVDVY